MKAKKLQIKAKFRHIPTHLTESQFNEFILPNLSEGGRGPACSIPLCHVFNYILHLLHTGVQWQHLPIKKDSSGKLDGAYDSRENRKLIFNAGVIPNIPENKLNRKKSNVERKEYCEVKQLILRSN